MPCLIITGMHRSGTSSIAGYLRACGLDLGHDLLRADEGNPLGYFEDREILEFHRRMLGRAGLDAMTIHPRSLPLTLDATMRVEAARILASKDHGPQWGWKEPRTALFLDLWSELIPEAIFLFLFRDPEAVLDSLLRRGTDPQVTRWPARGLRAWRAYNQELVRFARSGRATTIWHEIDDLVNDVGPLLGSLESMGFTLERAPVSRSIVPGALSARRTVLGRLVVRAAPLERMRCARLLEELRTLAST